MKGTFATRVAGSADLYRVSTEYNKCLEPSFILFDSKEDRTSQKILVMTCTMA